MTKRVTLMFMALSALPALAQEGPPPVVVVGIDQATQDELGAFGGSYRAYHDDLIRRLNAAGVRGIGFDISFSPNPDYAQETRTLARVAGASQAPVVIATYSEEGADGELQVYPNDEAFERAGVRQASIRAQGELIVEGGLPGVRRELEAAQREGRDPAVDLRVGEYAIVRNAGGQPTLVEQVAAATGLATAQQLPSERIPVGLRQNPETGEIELIEAEVIRPQARDPEAITTVSYLDVLEGRVDPALLRGAVVLVGMTDGVQDVVEAPNPDGAPDLERIPGVYLHAFGLQRTIEAGAARPRRRGVQPRVSKTRCGGTCGLVGGLSGN